MDARVGWAIVVFAILLLFPIQRAIDDARSEPPTIVETLPPEELLPILASGHRETLADFLEIKTINYIMSNWTFGVPFSNENTAHTWRLYNAIVELDPNNTEAYKRGSVTLYSIAGRPHDALALMDRGLGHPYTYRGKRYPAQPGVHPEHPQRWMLYHEKASIFFLRFRNRSRTERDRAAATRIAGQFWLLAFESGGTCPPEYEEYGERLSTLRISRLESLELELLQWKAQAEQGNEVTRREGRERMLETASEIHRLQMQRRVGLFRQVRRRNPKNLKEVIIKNVHWMKDPLGVGYLYNSRTGRIRSPGVEAARLERDLQDRFRLWQDQHPNRVPTLEDLEVDPQELPTFLEVELTSEGVYVRAKSI